MNDKIRTAIYGIFAPILRAVYRDRIAGKYIEGTSLKLYYEKAQHLGFLFRKKIEYEAAFKRDIMQFIKEGHLVFEIGSNIGQYSLVISEKIGQNGKLVCLEPDTNNFAFLSFNVRKNSCTNIELLHLAVSDKEGKTVFYKDTTTGGRMGSLIRKYTGDQYQGKTEEIETTTLRRLIEKFGIPDFIKVDVEGAETLIFSDKEILSAKTIYLIEVREETKKHIFELFTSAGFSLFLLEEEMKQINDYNDIPEFGNIILRTKSVEA